MVHSVQTFKAPRSADVQLPGSDTIRLSALGMNIVVANSLEVANELLDRRSSIYSDRLVH